MCGPLRLASLAERVFKADRHCRVLGLPSFLWLNNVPLYRHPTVCLSVQLPMGLWVVIITFCCCE